MRRVHAAAAGAAIAALVSTAAYAAFSEAGIASIYGPNDPGGRFGPTGERIDHTAFTAAHKTLPLGTLVEVINQRNGRAAVVRITDRGPYVRGRIIDLTPTSGKVLGVNGLDRVRIRIAPEHGCTFAERYGAALVTGQLLAYGRNGCPLASGDVDEEETRALKPTRDRSSSAAPSEKRRRAGVHYRGKRTASPRHRWYS